METPVPGGAAWEKHPKRSTLRRSATGKKLKFGDPCRPFSDPLRVFGPEIFSKL
jgi:hypothetical protein